jgi:pyruvate dehydrogenase E2 component (dihydrolipoamide acetyltransferase)
MSVSVSMPQLGESVTEGTVTRWLKREGEHVEADEPLLEVSTDKVDTEIPSPVSGVLRGISVAEDETVEVGAELAVIDEDGAETAAETAAPAAPAPARQQPAIPPEPAAQPVSPAPASPYEHPYQQSAPAPAAAAWEPPEPPAYPPQPPAPAPAAAGPAPSPPSPPPPQPQPTLADGAGAQLAAGGDGPYVTPLVRKLAAEHGIDLSRVAGTGVGGRIRKQDVLEAARALREAGGAPAGPSGGQAAAAPAGPPPPVPPAGAAAAAGATAPVPAPATAPAPGVRAVPADAGAPPAAARPPVVPSSLRGRTEKLSKARQVIAQRMVESLQASAQLTTVVEADVTEIARLRDRARDVFEAREGVKLSFLPFFALATVEALKVHPKLNAVIDTANGQVTYHDAEHLGIAVDTDRGLMVPVIRKAGDLNIAGLARKIADLAARTRAGQVSPDELSGGTFTLTNTGSRGALFDTPIINQPQVGILGTGTVVKRPVVVEDPALGEVITVRSMVYLALTYDHRLVDGADAARFLTTLRARLEEGAFEAELGL